MALSWLVIISFTSNSIAACHSKPPAKNLACANYLKNPAITPSTLLITNVTSTAQQSDTMRAAKRASESWFGEDKLAHFALSLTLTGASYHFIRCQLVAPEPRATVYALGFTFGCGLSKEGCDSTRPRNHFSYKDLLYDMLGAGAGYLLFIHQFR